MKKQNRDSRAITIQCSSNNEMAITVPNKLFKIILKDKHGKKRNYITFEDYINVIMEHYDFYTLNLIKRDVVFKAFEKHGIIEQVGGKWRPNKTAYEKMKGVDGVNKYSYYRKKDNSKSQSIALDLKKTEKLWKDHVESIVSELKHLEDKLAGMSEKFKSKEYIDGLVCDEVDRRTARELAAKSYKWASDKIIEGYLKG